LSFPKTSAPEIAALASCQAEAEVISVRQPQDELPLKCDIQN